jgi:hypothetical protein
MARNARRITITTFDPDPTGQVAVGLTANIWARVQAAWATRYGIANGSPAVSFTGYLTRTQPFLGNNAAGGGNANPYRNNGSPTIDTGLIEGPMGDPARRIFAERMARQAGGGK